MHRRPILASAAVLTALALPTTASAAIIEVGKAGPAATPSCPKPCFAINHTTGFQSRVAGTAGTMTIPQDGRIVAWTIALGTPGKKQVAFFNRTQGGQSTAQITVLRSGTKARLRVMGQGEPQRLQPFFGTTAQFPLAQTIPVKKGWIVGLTVPTWAPALSVGLGADTAWRAARPKGACDETQTQTAQTSIAQLAQYWCLYRTARLTYSATLIPTPKPPKAKTPKRKATAAR
jgi:hypothetical protein